MYKVYCIINGTKATVEFDSSCEFAVVDDRLMVNKYRKTIAVFAPGVWQFYKLVEDDSYEVEDDEQDKNRAILDMIR